MSFPYSVPLQDMSSPDIATPSVIHVQSLWALPLESSFWGHQKLVRNKLVNMQKRGSSDKWFPKQRRSSRIKVQAEPKGQWSSKTSWSSKTTLGAQQGSSPNFFDLLTPFPEKKLFITLCPGNLPTLSGQGNLPLSPKQLLTPLYIWLYYPLWEMRLWRE